MANGSTSSSSRRRASTKRGSRDGSKTPSSSSTSQRQSRCSGSGSTESSSRDWRRDDENQLEEVAPISSTHPSATAGPGLTGRESAKSALAMLLDIHVSAGGRREELREKLLTYLALKGEGPSWLASLLYGLEATFCETILSKPLLKSFESTEEGPKLTKRRTAQRGGVR